MTLSNLLSAVAGLIAVTCAAATPPALKAAAVRPASSYINYTTIPGYFLQDEPGTVPGTFDYTATNFGLINRTYSSDGPGDESLTQWQRFEHFVHELNQGSGRFVQYKVLFMGRHGEGYHNAAETYYGTPAWNCYWSEKDGNGTSTWADARIDPVGAAQAQIAAAFWVSRIKQQKIPLPESYYTSPLTRCLQTANITFSQLDLPSHRPFIPTVKEFFREGISGHTCDRRGSKTYIQENFPTYVIEEGFSEIDLLWRPLLGETSVDQDVRSEKALDDVFGSDHNTWVSITSHSGEITSLLRVLGHQPFSLRTGAVIPVLVRAETISEPAPPTTTTPWTSLSTCATPPPLPTPTV